MDNKPSCADPSPEPLSYQGLSPVFLKAAVGLVLLASLAFLVSVLLCAPDQPLRAVGPLVQGVISVISLLFLSRGKIRLALCTLIWSSWALASVVLFFFGGVRGTLVVLYPLLVMLSGWLLGMRHAVALSALSLAITLALMFGEQAGTLPAAPTTSAAMYGLAQVLSLVFSTLLIVFLVRTYRKRLAEVDGLSQKLARLSTAAQSIAADLNIAQAVAHIGSWVYDFSTDRIVMSAETCRILELPEDLVATREAYLKRVHPDDLAQLEEDWEEALKGKAMINEHRIMIDNTPRWICQRGELEFFPDGRPQRCVGTVQDITAIKHSEDEIRIAAARLHKQ